MPDLTASELARRLGVARSTVTRALTGGRSGIPDPDVPAPVNPGEPQLRYPLDAVQAWWPKRRALGRPKPTAGPAPEGEAAVRQPSAP